MATLAPVGSTPTEIVQHNSICPALITLTYLTAEEDMWQIAYLQLISQLKYGMIRRTSLSSLIELSVLTLEGFKSLNRHRSAWVVSRDLAYPGNQYTSMLYHDQESEVEMATYGSSYLQY
ncbi:hypothetical protein PGTUg99_025883 [Puccinia graminis f. sp. tritici]|uniref:Uncharacterized protein n=1 Tax=Puccinia graminis f. sp. tritici TaxID=56615 RepID=A0A5B0RDQ5_PUCGR|nr:hypothetical protein PGTUg99_025883 [Puccinia graminis f. sp. tritici]